MTDLMVLMIVCTAISATMVVIIGTGLTSAISNLKKSIDHMNDRQSNSNINEGAEYIDDGK
jgi:hypothetical protein